ncbi:MAG: DUF3775 domain-containing protein [Rhizomicrobium sp.]|jgi:DNA-directed RNA polymerase sigma subunit (sigma70/sigma32)
MPIVENEPDDPEVPELGISTEKVDEIIAMARQFDAKEGDSDPDEGSDAIDDGEMDVLEDKPQDDAVRQELAAFISGLDEEERMNLVALAWVGRGTYDLSEWSEALETARNEHRTRAAQYLLELPLLGDYLADGLAAFGEGFSENEVD